MGIGDIPCRTGRVRDTVAICETEPQRRPDRTNLRLRLRGPVGMARRPARGCPYSLSR
jgi:hypothetical protein